MKKKQGNLRWITHPSYSIPAVIKNTTIAYHADDVITFIDTINGEQKIYQAFGSVTGDGISCVTGHPTFSIFAFSELKYNPNIYVMLYPSMEKIKVLAANDIGKYIDIRFTDSEYLICLTGYPHFKIVVWNFRRGIIISEHLTGIPVENQRLIASASPNLCAQYSSVSREINIWEISSTGEKAYLSNKNVKVSFIKNEIKMAFGFDGNLYVINSDGIFYMLNCTTCFFKKLWKWEDRINKDEKWDIAMYKGGFLITNSKISMKYIKKDKTWNVIFTIELDYAINISRSVNNYEKVFFFTSDETIKVLIDNPTESAQPYLSNVGKTGPIIKCFSIIKPYSKQVAILTQSEEIHIIDIVNGNFVAKIECKDAVYFSSFLKLPVLVVGTTDGTVQLISCYDVKNPKLLTDFKLNSYPVKEIVTTENYIVIYDTSKTFFIIKGRLGSDLIVVKYFQVSYDILKLVGIEKTPTSLHLYIIQIENNQNIPMNIVCVKYENDKIIEKYYSLKFQPLDLLAMDNRLFVTRLISKDIYEITFPTNGDQNISYELWLKTCHHVKYVKFFGSENTIMTWSFDGIIIIYNFDTKDLNYDFIVQNRRNFFDYIKVAQCTPNQKYCFILTNKGTLKCYTTKERILDLAPSYKLESYFATETKSPFRSIGGRSWIEDMSYVKIQNEKVKFAMERAKIYQEFLIVKEKLNRLVDENESLEDPDDRVPLSNLNLAKEYTQIIIDKARKNREAEEKILRKFIADQNRITNLILSKTWSNMLIKNQKIFGIATHIACENYALSQFDMNAFKNLELRLNIHRKKEVACDIWHPYLPPWQPNLDSRGYDRIRTLVSQSQDKSTLTIISEMDYDSKYDYFNLSGTETHLFIVPHPAQYHQFEIVSFNQMFIQEFLVAFDVRELKKHFNEIFEAMIKTKQDAVRYVKIRNERFREIESEMNALAVLKGDDPNYSICVDDPVFESQEIPELVTKVEPNEVKIKPYISPSEQRLLDDIAYKEELRRLALLADDFRERALIVMMDGVLEKRWEDEIKKEVPKPDCLLKGKDPAEYTKEDMKALIDYEEKVKFILSERERYRIMLIEEEKKLQSVQDDSIFKFNLKCGELFLKKLNYDAAVKQEELKLLRTCFYNFQRMKFKQKEYQINDNLAEKREKVNELSAITSEIEKKVLECQQKYEQSINRDKLLEKSFKGQFAESAPSFVIDSAFKLFKRRPKWQQKAWATPTIYIELANIIGNKPNTKMPLPPECYEYLNLLESNDSYSQAPSIIDQKLWELLCRLRRNKIENEFRVRASGLLLAETEATLNTFLKETAATKLAISTNEKELHDLGLAYQEYIKNRTVQIVMPMGLVEVPLSGQINDFRGSLLLSRDDIADINSIIKRAGEKKLKSMQRLAVFRRKVLMKEWEHKALQMSVEDLRDFLNVIEKTVVTFEMRQWLREKAEKRVVEITNAYLTEKVSAKLAYLNKSLKEIDERISETAKRIDEQRLENSKLDKSIKFLNVEVTSRNLTRDLLFEEKQAREQKERMAICMERSRLIRKVQTGHLQMLELATLLELQKLKTFPTLNPLMKNVCQIASNQ